MKYTKEHRGYEINVYWEQDEDMGPPWKEHDGHGVVSEWASRDKRPGELILISDSHGRSKRFYDLEATMKLAKQDGWGLHPDAVKRLADKLGRKPTARQILEASVTADYEYLRDWCNDKWHWQCRDVRIEGMSYRDALCGIEGTDDVIKEYTEEAFEDAIRWLDNELTEREDAECRDIVTV